MDATIENIKEFINTGDWGDIKTQVNGRNALTWNDLSNKFASDGDAESEKILLHIIDELDYQEVEDADGIYRGYYSVEV